MTGEESSDAVAFVMQPGQGGLGIGGQCLEIEGVETGTEVGRRANLLLFYGFPIQLQVFEVLEPISQLKQSDGGAASSVTAEEAEGADSVGGPKDRAEDAVETPLPAEPGEQPKGYG